MDIDMVGGSSMHLVIRCGALKLGRGGQTPPETVLQIRRCHPHHCDEHAFDQATEDAHAILTLGCNALVR